MFIKTVTKKNSTGGKQFIQFSLVQNSRINGIMKQRNLLYLGSDELLLNQDYKRKVLVILKAKIFNQPSLFPSDAPPSLITLAESYYTKYTIKYGEEPLHESISIPPDTKKIKLESVDIANIESIDVKTFGAENLCKQMLDRLDLASYLKSLGWESIDIQKALLVIAAKAIFGASEYKTSQYLEDNSDLKSICKIEHAISHKQLYRMSDKLFEVKEGLDKYLYTKICNLFNLEDCLVIFDISNTYFEGKKVQSDLAQYGRSKEKRYDCKQVVFTGVINVDGFIRHSKIYEGNKPDVRTLTEMINELEKNSNSKSQKTVVLDAGIADEDNLEYLRSKGYKYVCVSRKRLSDYELDINKPNVKQLTDRDKNIIELNIFKPKEYEDIWMYVKSPLKKIKEQSIDVKLSRRFEEDLTEVISSLSKTRGIKKLTKVHERIGRLKQKHRQVASHYKIEVISLGDRATNIVWFKQSSPVLDDKLQGVYFLRTNLDNIDEPQFWNIFNLIREVESTFRCLKSDLNIRPVHHQLDHRIESHLYLTLLAYQLVNSIRHLLKQQAILLNWNNIVRLMNTQIIQTLIIPAETKTIKLRKPSLPIGIVKNIYQACACASTVKPSKEVVYH